MEGGGNLGEGTWLVAPGAASRVLRVAGILRPWLSLLRWPRPVFVVAVEVRWKGCAALEGDRGRRGGVPPSATAAIAAAARERKRESFTVIKNVA